jgi:hypothetical protein
MTASTALGGVYVSAGDISATMNEYGSDDATGLNDFRLFFQDTDHHTYAYCYAQAQLLDAGIISAGTLTGYVAVSRTANNRVDVYYANSLNSHASKTNNTVVETHTPSVVNQLYVFADLDGGNGIIQRSKKRLSAAFFGTGLTAAESLALFNAIQAARVALGGGYI